MIKSNYPNHPNDFIQEELNEHDKSLVDKAYTYSYVDWNLIKEEEAETIEGYQILHRRCSHLYHMEEAINGNL